MTNEEMFNQNINIAYKIANKYKINHPNEYEDIKQIALLGLWKAVLNFDKSRGFAFSTFAYRVIYNEINMYLRKPQIHIADVSSLQTPVGKNIILEDTIVDDFDMLDNLEYREIQKIKNNILNKLSNRDKQIYLELEKGKIQQQVADKFNLTQAYISRIQSKIIKQIKENYLKGGN
jgi:RNA polymerase sporulation-specific sigma factor